MHTRLFHWINYRFDVPGYLHYGWNRWSDQPFQDARRQLGDSFLVYPGNNTLINSIRWEQMRNGIQDYEYFWMLENEIRALKDSLGPRFSWINPNHHGRRLSRQVVPDFTRFTSDPKTLYDTKRAVLDHMRALRESPRSYIEIRHPRGDRATPSRRVEVFKWIEPGSAVTVNGEEVPLEGGNLLADDVVLSPSDNVISIEITRDKNRRIIRREVDIRY